MRTGFRSEYLPEEMFVTCTKVDQHLLRSRKWDSVIRWFATTFGLTLDRLIKYYLPILWQNWDCLKTLTGRFWVFTKPENEPKISCFIYLRRSRTIPLNIDETVLDSSSISTFLNSFWIFQNRKHTRTYITVGENNKFWYHYSINIADINKFSVSENLKIVVSTLLARAWKPWIATPHYTIGLNCNKSIPQTQLFLCRQWVAVSMQFLLRMKKLSINRNAE